MTHLEAGNASYKQARAAMAGKNYGLAARLYVHAKEMFQHHEWQFGSTSSPAINAATRGAQRAIRMRDNLAAA